MKAPLSSKWSRRLVFVAAALLVAGLVALLITQVLLVDESESVDTRPAGAFYTAPDPVPSGPAGTIIRSQPHLVPKAMGAPVGTKATAVLYTSRDYVTGKPIAVSGVIYQPPPGPLPKGGRPVVAWAHGTTGIASPCAPSLQANPSQVAQPGFAGFLSQGWIVTTTDYTGLGTQGPHPYLIGNSSGREVLDSIRAARLLPGTGAGDRAIVAGHSQGGQSALFAAALAKKYAPEIRLLGVSAVAPAAELKELLQLDANETAGVIVSSLALWSWSHTQPGADLSAVVGKEGRDLIDSIASRCINSKKGLLEDLPAAAEALALHAIDPAKLQANPVWAQIESENTPPLPAAGPPLLIAQGTADTLIRPQTTAQVVTTLCARRRIVLSVLMPGVQHPDAGLAAAPKVLVWAQNLFAGGRPSSNCPA